MWTNVNSTNGSTKFDYQSRTRPIRTRYFSNVLDSVVIFKKSTGIRRFVTHFPFKFVNPLVRWLLCIIGIRAYNNIDKIADNFIVPEAEQR